MQVKDAQSLSMETQEAPKNRAVQSVLERQDPP
jgi:hypothetical protein